MDYITIMDEECRFTFVSGVSDGTFDSPEELIGKRPWDFVLEEDKIYIRGNITRIYEEGVDRHSFLYLYRFPDNPERQIFYHHELFWVGDGKSSVVTLVRELACDVRLLSDREHESFVLFGRGHGVKETAREIGVTISTIHSHLKKIRDKLHLDSNEEVTAVAAIYADTLKNQERLESSDD